MSHPTSAASGRSRPSMRSQHGVNRYVGTSVTLPVRWLEAEPRGGLVWDCTPLLILRAQAQPVVNHSREQAEPIPIRSTPSGAHGVGHWAINPQAMAGFHQHRAQGTTCRLFPLAFSHPHTRRAAFEAGLRRSL